MPAEIPGDELDERKAFLVQVTLDKPPKARAAALDRLTVLDAQRAMTVAQAVVKRGRALAEAA